MTVSGFPEFSSRLESELLNFATTQEFVTDPNLLTETDPDVLITATGIASFDSAIFEIFSQLVATATDMALSDRAEFESEFLAAVSSVTSTGAQVPTSKDLANTAGPSATGYDTPTLFPTEEAPTTPTPFPPSEEAPTKPTGATVTITRVNAAGLAGMDLLSVSCAMTALIVAVAVAL